MPQWDSPLWSTMGGRWKNLETDVTQSVIIRNVNHTLLWVELCLPQRYVEALPPGPQNVILLVNRIIIDVNPTRLVFL